MATFNGTTADETITPSFVSPTVTTDPAGAFPSDAVDSLDGGAGSDTLDGGGGDDTLRVANHNSFIYLATPSSASIDGGSGTDTAIISFQFTEDDVAADLTSASDGVHTVSLTNVERLVVLAGEGDDYLQGGSGDDYLDGGGTAPSGGGINTLVGGDGNDFLSSRAVTGPGGSVDGGDGVDTVASLWLYNLDVTNVEIFDFYWANTSQVSARVDQIAAFTGFTDVTGTNPASTMSFFLVGAGGTIDFSAIAFGQHSVGLDGTTLTSALTATGSAGTDTINGGASDDTLNGFDGNDFIVGFGGNDTVSGGAGSDTLNGGAGNNTIDGGTGDDDITSSGTFDIVTGGDGDDTLRPGHNGGTIDGGAGVDTVRAGILAAYGFSNVEVLDAGSNLSASAAQLASFATITDSSAAADSRIEIMMQGAGGTVDLSTRVAGAHSVYVRAGFGGLAGGVNVTATVNNDILEASNSYADTLDGHAGDDTIYTGGGAAPKTLSGGEGNDLIHITGGTGSIDGGNGTDTVRGDTFGNFSYSNVEILDTVGNTFVLGSIAAFASFATITDTVGVPRQLTLALQGAGGTLDLSTRMAAGFSANVIEWGGNAVTSGIAVTGSILDDQLSGSSHGDTLNGGDGNDTLFMTFGNDSLNGGNGNDTFKVATGTQGTMDGGAGIDTAMIGHLGLFTFADVEVLDAPVINGTVAGYASFATITDSAGAANSQIDVNLFGTGGTLDLSTRVAGAHSVRVTDNGLGGAVTVTGSVNNDQISGSAFDDILDGAGGNDSLNGLGGNDTASYAAAGAGVTVKLAVTGAQDTGGAGIDTLASFDNLAGSAFDDELRGNGGNNRLAGADGDDVLRGGTGDDTLEGGDGGDVLAGESGADAMAGGDGNDIYDVNSGGDTVTELADEGIDTVRSSRTTYALGDNVENLSFVGVGNFSGTGNTLDNTITSSAGNDTIDGAGGSDTASYADAGAGVTVNLAVAGPQSTGGAGSDTLVSIENAIGSSFADTLIGTTGDNVLSGGLGDDILDGSLGDDMLNGGGGSGDTATYALAGAGVTVSLATTSAQDTVGAGLDLVLDVENLVGSAFDDTLTGKAGSNRLVGGLGNDTLDGGSGVDTLEGGDGNDTYHIDHVDDVVVEAINKGSDTVVTTLLAYTLKNQFENLSHAGAGKFTGTGNSADNILTGGVADDTLRGGLGNDTLHGGGGQDTASYSSASAGVTVSLVIAGPQNTGPAGVDSLISIESLEGSDFADTLTGDGAANVLTGRNGNDVLDGSGGTDTMNGGAGDDLYFVDDAADKVTEGTNKGTDTVSATAASYVLAANVEILTYAGGGDFTGTGNTLANTLTGGNGDDTLIGGQGADTLNGGIGTDIAGYATAVTASLAAPGSNTGEAAGDSYNSIEGLRGSKFADTLTGDDGDNVLASGGGMDTLTGGLGGDTFVFDHTVAAGNVVTVADFTVGSDTIQLSLAIFAAAGPAGTLAAAAFRIGNVAQDADDRIIYNSVTGKLLYDADGAGGTAAKAFAVVGTGLALTESSFVLA
jgi:Ca2+-binding RTX toxin-like protein